MHYVIYENVDSRFSGIFDKYIQGSTKRSFLGNLKFLEADDPRRRKQNLYSECRLQLEQYT